MPDPVVPAPPANVPPGTVSGVPAPKMPIPAPKKVVEDPCEGLPMHVGAPKHCRKCPDSQPAGNNLRAEPGEHGLVAK
jgi:hypothetical protein